MRPPKGLDDILPTYWPAIHRAVTQSLRKGWGHSAPSLLAKTDPLTGMLGTGMWGAAYRATPRRWVVKITTDEREAIVYHEIAVKYGKSSLRSHPGIAYFADAWQLADQARAWEYTSYQPYTVYVLLREDVVPLKGIVDEATYAAIGDELWALRQDAIDYDHARGAKEKIQLKQNLTAKLVDVRKNRPELYHVIEFMWLYANITDFALADVHGDNIGRKPGAKHWAIFDLGHPVSVGPHPTKPLFRVLKP